MVAFLDNLESERARADQIGANLLSPTSSAGANVIRDNPASGAAFTTEGNLDAQGPQEGLSARQASSERTRIRPVVTVPSKWHRCCDRRRHAEDRAAPCPRAALRLHPSLATAMDTLCDQLALGSSSIDQRARSSTSLSVTVITSVDPSIFT
jgi:hypothetical protein